MAGARPTLTGVTNDASRGGLFDQSNIASPVSGADISGTVVNDSTITLSITINGDTQTQTFTTNQAADSTESFTFTIADGGGNGMDTADGVVNGGGFNPANGVLTLTRSNGLPDLTYSGFTFTPRTNQEIEDLADDRITASTTIVKSVNGVTPTDNTGAITINPGVPDLTNFESSDTVVFRAGVTDTSDISADARIPLTGNDGIGAGVMSGSTVNAQRIVLAQDTGLVLTESSGVVTIQAAGSPPAPAGTPAVTSPNPMSALMPAPEQTVTFRGQGSDTVTMVASVSVTNPDNNPVTGVTSDTTGGVGTITIPAGSTNAPGDYQVRADVTTMSTDGQTRTVTETPVIDRFIPFFQSRTDMTTATEITSAMISMGSFEDANDRITAITGSRVLYFAVITGSAGLASSITMATDVGTNFRVRVGFLRPVQVMFPDGIMRTYNVFRAPVNGGVTIGNFS